MNLLTKAMQTDTADEAASIIQQALGITDGGVAANVFPTYWPRNVNKRAQIISDWLRTEIVYAVPEYVDTAVGEQHD